MKTCIGIVSYLPDNAKDRLSRQNRLNRLVKQINELFPQNIDILVIAQNWREFNVISNYQRIIKYSYDKLGILKARQTLRLKFLECGYDYIIMFDDDAIIQGTKELVNKYLKLMEQNPLGWCFIKGTDPNGYADSQLNLCAVSRYIYEQQPIPAIDPQKSEGFEDRIFSCLLKNAYSAFEFNEPVGLKCTHFKNMNEPLKSTWSDEQNYNWRYMRARTAEIEDYIRKNKQLPDLATFKQEQVNSILPQIDLVVPYVDSNDPVWIKLFNQYNPDKNKEIEAINAKNRFRGQGDFFRFFFRGIESNLSWIRNIYLIVQNKTQIPHWLDTSKVKIITHADFIPKEFLPTFNSCTIELFLWNIPDLSQNFIYANDDVFILNKLNPSDFIENGKIKETFKHNRLDGMFGKHCDNVNKLIFGNLDNFIRPTHGLRFYLKSELIKCYNAYKLELNKSITKFRAPNNFNCFVYNLWQVKQKLTINPGIPCEYMTKCNIAALNSATTVCINDTDPDLNIYSDINLITWFYHKLSKKSRFELTDYKPKLVEKRTMADGKPGCYLYF